MADGASVEEAAYEVRSSLALAPEAGFASPEALAAALGDDLSGIDTITRAYAAINAAATPTAEKKSATSASLSPASS